MANETVGYVTPLGYLHCPVCKTNADEPITRRELLFSDESCNGCGVTLGGVGNTPNTPVHVSGSGVNWEYQANELPIRLPFSIKVF